jgi:hypothetical protein
MEHNSKKKKTFFSRCPQWSGIAWIQFTSILTLVLIFVWIMDSDFLGTWSGIAISFSPSNSLQNWKTFVCLPILLLSLTLIELASSANGFGFGFSFQCYYFL